MEKKVSRKRSNKTRDDHILRVLTGLVLVFVLGGLASAALKYHWLLQTSFDLEDDLPGDSHILMWPSILHVAAMMLLLGSAGFILRKYLFPTKKLTWFYILGSLLVVIFQGWSIFRLTGNPSPKLNWTIIQTQGYLDVPVAAEILRVSKQDETNVCGLLENSKRSALVSATTSDGSVFRKSPSRDFVLKTLSGKIPEICTDKGAFDTGRILAEYYPSLAWFGRECNMENNSQACLSTKKNLLAFGASEKAAWKPTNFHKRGESSFLEFVANPGDSIVFVQDLLVKENEMGVNDLAKHSAEASSAKAYKVYFFDCARRVYATLPREFIVNGPHWRNRPIPVSALKLEPLSQSGAEVTSYSHIGCK